MAGGRHPNALRQRETRGHAVVRDAIDRGYINSDQVYVIPPAATHEQANEARKWIKVAGDHYGVSAAPWVTDQDGMQCWKACRDLYAPHGVNFKLWSKDEGRRHVVRQSGGNPANLKYNPFRRAEPRLVDDAGKRI
jgi:hypothetical protein